MPKRYDNSRVLFISDTHFPYEHKRTFPFIRDVIQDFRPDRIIHGGDLLDLYGVSVYPKDINHPDSWNKELKDARERVQELASLIEEMIILESNHDDRGYKKSSVAGVPREFLVPYNEMVGAPDSWKWHRDLTIRCEKTRECMFFAHTKTGGSSALSKDLRMTSVIGHHHTKFGATAWRGTKGSPVWAVDGGCFISDKGAPFSYNKGDRGRPIQGCCVLIEGTPVMIPMN